MNRQLLVVIIVLFHALNCYHEADAGFTSGQPCSERNTAYLMLSKVTTPPNPVQCVDITGMAKNVTAFKNLFPYKNHLKTADTLYANNMNLSKVPIGILRFLPKVTLVDFSGNYIRKIPRNLDKIGPSITKFIIPDNRVQIRPKKSLLKSSRLQTLMLSDNKIKKLFPFTFENVPSLEVLFLDNNLLTLVSAQVFKPLQNLKYLHLGKNLLKRVPPRISLPPKLKIYIIKDNKLTK